MGLHPIWDTGLTCFVLMLTQIGVCFLFVWDFFCLWRCFFLVFRLCVVFLFFLNPFNTVVWNNLTVTMLKLRVIKVVAEGCGFPLGKYHTLLNNSAYRMLTLAFHCKGWAVFEQWHT